MGRNNDDCESFVWRDDVPGKKGRVSSLNLPPPVFMFVLGKGLSSHFSSFPLEHLLLSDSRRLVGGNGFRSIIGEILL